MSSVNREKEKRRFSDTKVDKSLFKRNPAIIDDFYKWYADYQKEHTTFPANINEFFNISFIWTVAVWWDYFYDCGIDIAVGENKTYVFFNDRESSKYSFLSGRTEIFYVESNADPSARFEEAVAELICRIDLPF